MQERLEKKETMEDKEFKKINATYDKLHKSPNKIFYSSLILLNILTLIICGLYLTNTVGVVKFIDAFTLMDLKFWSAILVSFVLILMLKTLPLFLKTYSKMSKRKFCFSYLTMSNYEFYKQVTIYSNTAKMMSTKVMCDMGVKPQIAIDVNYSKRYFERICVTLFSLIIMILGMIFCNKINPWFIVFAGLNLVINLVIILLVISLYFNKNKTLNFISKFVKFLYDLRLTKDYEMTYTKLVDRLIILAKELKQNKLITFVEIVSNILVIVIKYACVYFALATINFIDVSAVLELLYLCVIFDMILELLPVPNGTLFFEILFVLIFKNFFFEGYVFWGLILYRIVTYFGYIVNYLIILPICKSMKSKQENKIKGSV